jgi:hypothetical protein
VNERGHPPEALSASLEIVRSNVKDALRIRHIRIHANHRDALGHSVVNRCLENFVACRGEADSGGMLFHDLAEHSDLCVWVVGRGTDEFTLYAEPSGRVQKTCLGLLPIRQVNIRGHEHVALVFLVVGFRTRRNQSRSDKNKNRYERDPLSSHWNSPFAPWLTCGRVCSYSRKIWSWDLPGLEKFERTWAPPTTRPLRFRTRLVGILDFNFMYMQDHRTTALFCQSQIAVAGLGKMGLKGQNAHA